MSRRQLFLAVLADAGVTTGFGLLVATTLGFAFLSSPNWPTGGDAASHLLYAWFYSKEALPAGQITPWMPEVFAGLPFLSYYFPLPFMVIAGLASATSLAIAFKWGSFLAAMLLPGAAYVTARRAIDLPFLPAFGGALGCFAFLLHEQNSIWGGNLLSTLAGEFAYSYGLLFALLATLQWSRVAAGRGRWITASLLEAATGFCHGFPLLVVGFSTLFLLPASENPRRLFWQLAAGHLLAFCLLGGWLWPMLEMHGITIPNDAAFTTSGWQDLLPAALWPVLAAGGIGLAALTLPPVKPGFGPLPRWATTHLVASASLAALAFVTGDQMGLADIRFFPMVWLFGAIACGWLAGWSVDCLAGSDRIGNAVRLLLGIAALTGLLGWLGPRVVAAPDWSLWNHSGLNAKPQWINLSRLFHVLRGDAWSPRLVFEHDPDNHDIGSTRSLEALPMFIGRPVLEGLYMESALIGPAIYQLQSEVSARPSSPLVRFPSGSLDPTMAAKHMKFLHADMLLLRSEAARQAIEDSGRFQRVAEALPFAVFRLRDFDSQWISVVRTPINVRPLDNWMHEAFAWFRHRQRFEASLPVFGAPANLRAGREGTVVPRQLERHRIAFDTTAIGQPHLIKMSWHPRWQLRTPGQLYRAGPGFMLVVPEQKSVELEFGHTVIGQAGMVATTLATAVLLLLGWRSRQQAHATGIGSNPRIIRLAFFAGPIMLATGGWFLTHAPEPIYQRGWEAMRTERYDEAADLFNLALARRKPPAKKEEALFWHAKASELAGRRAAAITGYRQLVDHHHGYWVPESLYTLALLLRQEGQASEAFGYEAKLREDYSEDKWARKLGSLKQ